MRRTRGTCAGRWCVSCFSSVESGEAQTHVTLLRSERDESRCGLPCSMRCRSKTDSVFFASEEPGRQIVVASRDNGARRMARTNDAEEAAPALEGEVPDLGGDAEVPRELDARRT